MDWTIKTLDEAASRGAALSDDVLAQKAEYVAPARMLRVELANGASFTCPVDKVEGLAGASDADLANIEITGLGFGLHWPALDVDFTVGGLAAGIFGTAAHMARQAGRQTSEAKARAARANGAKGGRPPLARNS